MFRIIRASLKITLCLLAVSFFNTCIADEVTNTVIVAADIPQQNGLTITISKVTGTTWAPATNLEFGNLIYDEQNKIFTADSYYAVDVGIDSNAADWTLTHSATSISNDTGNLDNNINVTFVRQQDADNGTELAKLSYTDSKNKTFRKADLSDGWLRIYYGIATGNEKDATGTTPIVATSASSGPYKGSINVTLTS